MSEFLRANSNNDAKNSPGELLLPSDEFCVFQDVLAELAGEAKERTLWRAQSTALEARCRDIFCGCWPS